MLSIWEQWNNVHESLKNRTYLGKIFFNFLGAYFLMPKSGHWLEKQPVLGPGIQPSVILWKLGPKSRPLSMYLPFSKNQKLFVDCGISVFWRCGLFFLSKIVNIIYHKLADFLTLHFFEIKERPETSFQS